MTTDERQETYLTVNGDLIEFIYEDKLLMKMSPDDARDNAAKFLNAADKAEGKGGTEPVTGADARLALAKRHYWELWEDYVNFIEAVESIAKVDYWGFEPMAAAEWERAQPALQGAVRSARRGIGQP